MKTMMMALMVFSINVFAISEQKAKFIKIAKEARTELSGLNSVQSILDMINAKSIKENLTDEILQVHLKMYNLYSKYKVTNDKKYLTEIIKLYDNEASKTNSIYPMFAYKLFKNYKKTYTLAIKNNNTGYAIESLLKLKTVSQKEIEEVVKIKNTGPKDILKIVNLIKKQNQTTVENQVKVLKMFVFMSTNFPPSNMKEGTELDWAKVQVRLNNNMEKIQKLIKINLDIERALNE